MPAHRTHRVANNKPVPVTVYDYYDRQQTSRVLYEPRMVTVSAQIWPFGDWFIIVILLDQFCDLCDLVADEPQCKKCDKSASISYESPPTSGDIVGGGGVRATGHLDFSLPLLALVVSILVRRHV